MLLLLACAPIPVVDTDDPCDLRPAGDLDLERACVDGVCGGAQFPEAKEAWGEPDSCPSDGRVATCVWAAGRTVTFPDCDQDGAPDAEYLCDIFDQTFTLEDPWAGATADGLGRGLGAGCWARVLGGPGPWELGFNPRVRVTVTPDLAPVDRIGLDWSFDE
jgi:hypothetical protein